MRHFIGVYNYTVILTYMSLLSGFIGAILSAKGLYAISMILLFAAGVFDAFDGIVARSKKDRTEDEKGFGIQLDSLVDVVSFGIYPALLCYFMGADSIIAIIIEFLYCNCAVIRLAFFNVLEANRQKSETGAAKYYRGLPVTSISIIFPVIFLLKYIVSPSAFLIIIQIMLAVVAFLFIYDFRVPKPDYTKILFRHK